MKKETNEHNNAFVELYSSNFIRIRAFILSLVPNVNEADDILQETSKIMWQKFDQYQPGTNFCSWAVTIAKYEILKYRRDHHSRVPFGSDIIEILAEECQGPVFQDDERLDALRGCLKKLNPKDQHFIQFRFEHKKTARELSKQIGVAMNTIYRNELRILHHLQRCINKTLGVTQI